MAKGLITHAYLENTADAIRVLRGESDTYTPDEFGEKIIDAIPTETASGNPINVTDAANYPAESAVTTLEPVQDLHGYSKPWPAGGGGNLLSTGNAFDATVNDVRFQSDGNGTYTISGDTSNSAYYIFDIPEITLSQSSIYVHLLNSIAISTGALEFFYNNTNLGFVAMLSQNRISNLAALSGATINKLRLNFNNGISGSITLQPMLMLTDTVTSYIPYSNECPISGHTGVELTRVGKNLLNITAESQTINGVTFTVNKDSAGNVVSITANGTATANAVFYLNRNFEITDDRTYIYSGCPANGSDSTFRMDCYYRNIPGTAYDYGNGVTISVSDVAGAIKIDTFIIAIISGYTANNLVFKPMVRLATDTPETHSVTFPQAQSPVYGCEVDWVNGVLRIKDVKETKIWRDRDGTQLTNVIRGVFVLQNLTVPVNERNTEKMCNVAPYKAVYNDDTIHFYVQTDANNREARAYVFLPTNTDENTEIEICYPLATPLEIPLTPEIITLLKGENNVWTDAGESEIGYKVDLNSYIQKLIDEASASASALSVSPLLGKSAAVSTDSEDDGEIEDVDEPAEESEEAEDLTAKKEIAEDLVKENEPDEAEESASESKNEIGVAVPGTETDKVNSGADI